MRAVDAIMECLKAEGVEHVFGIPGGANLPTYDALYDAGVRHIQCRHEQGAGHAAEGYAKASGKVGVALATSGPGATNLVTAIADAIMDSVPTVFITGQVRTDLIGTDGFQEADVSGITMPIVKHSIMIQDPREIPKAMHEAFHIARTGPPGPGARGHPAGPLARGHLLRAGRLGRPARLPAHHRGQRQADPPGGQGAGQRAPARDLRGRRRDQRRGVEGAHRAVPVRQVPGHVHAHGPRRASPRRTSSGSGMLGMHGTRAANYAMDEADLICCVGARFDDRITGKLAEFAPRAKFIHIDIDPAEISKNVPAHIPIVGDAKNIVPKLTAEYRALETDTSRLDGWWERIHGWQEKHPLGYEDSEGSEIKPQRMIEALYEVTGGKAIVTSDVGQHQMWCAQYFHFSGPRQWINSGGLGTMGFGLPSAMGAKVARPDEQVVCVAGDGSVVMNIQELATCVDENIPIKVFIMNNGYLGMVRQWQELFWDRRYSAVKMGSSPDWVKLAEAFGAKGLKLEDKNELVDGMKSALAEDGPVVCDVRVTPEENCYPMIPAGQAARDMVG